MKTLPPPVRKTVCHTLMGAERQTLVEGLDFIPTEIGRKLVKEFGETIMLNPKVIPHAKLQELMPRSITSRIKELHTLYGIREGSYRNKNSTPAKEQEKHAEDQSKTAEEPADLLHGPAEDQSNTA